MGEDQFFGLDVAASNFPGSEAFIDLWNDKRGNRRLPMWSDYDWYDLASWWGFILVTDYFYEPFDFQYRLFGTMAVERFEIDVTGKKASELQEGRYDLSDDMEFYEMVAREPYISRASGNIYWQNREFVNVTFIELPLSDTGDRATHSVALMI